MTDIASEPALSTPPATDVGEPPRVAFVALGCPKNLVDSEKMLGSLAESGYAVGADEDDADVIIINTCGFLEASQREAVEHISEAVDRKRRGEVGKVVVAGCLVSRLGEELRTITPELDEVDAMVGVNSRDALVPTIDRLLGRSPAPTATGLALPIFTGQPDAAGHLDTIGPSAATFKTQPHVAHVSAETARLRLTPRHYAYLRVSEGCNQKCTFCTIPSIRGRMSSKRLDGILAEADELLADGAVELNLIGQDTTSYAEDIAAAERSDAENAGLVGLIRGLDAFVAERTDEAWLRLMYAYPSTFTDAMIDALAAAKRFVPYIDVPLQHAADEMLHLMRRRVTAEQQLAVIEKLRAAMPNFSLRTTFIVGFPGETETHFQTLLDFIDAVDLEMCGAFQYSPEPGTPAAKLPNQVPEDVKQDRYDRLMAAQQKKAFARAEAMIGQQLRVLVDSHLGETDEGDPVHAARHAGQAPEIDSLVAVTGPTQPGEFVTVEVVERDGYDLIGRVAESR